MSVSVKQQEQGEGPENEALEAIDRFVEAFNARDRDGLIASFTPHATVFQYNVLVDGFRQGPGAAPDNYTWMLDGDLTYEIQVLQRVASGCIIFQRERLAYTLPNGQSGGTERSALYKARDGRVQSIWQLPIEQSASSVPTVERPTFETGKGPKIFVDVAHFNHHRPELSYWPFSQLLKRDGYVVSSWPEEFRKAALDSAGVDVLVIANATSEKNAEELFGWRLPTPSAFKTEEVTELEAWVRDGGSLLLIADHIPWPGAAAELAAAFGAEFHNGAARDTAQVPSGIFRRSEETLRAHLITDGWSMGERVDSVITFTGQAFRPLEPSGETLLQPLLVFRKSAVLLQPEVWGQTTADTPRIPVPGWWQGAAGTHGRGRVALFGEAAMFRILTEEAGLPVGMQNAQLVRNTIYWLSGR